VFISSYQVGGSGGGSLPMEQVSLNYAKILQEYKEQKPDGSLGGSVKLGYDWSKNVKI
jgi:type VI secretion system secreted protein Hcp